MLRLFCLLAGLLLPASALAADLTLTLRTPKGAPVRDAVVTVYPGGKAPGGAIRFSWPYRMVQQNLQFDPFVLIVPVGAEVSFPNKDEVRHQVYSFSPIKAFELKLYGKDESRSIRFDKPGAVALGCNIHDQMVSFIKVVDTPLAARSAANGVVTVGGVPAGPATVRIWHPYLKAPGNEVARQVVLAPGGHAEIVALDLRAPPRAAAY